jgi:hypothetical protein
MLGTPAAVHAAGVGEAGGTTGPGSGGVLVVVPGSDSGGYPIAGAAGGGGGPSNVECAYFGLAGDANVGAPVTGDRVLDTSTVQPGSYLWLVCRDRSTGAITYENLFVWDPANPPALVPSAATLAQIAANRVVLPLPGARTWPPAGSAGLVNLPVWLHVDNWGVLSASASAGGLTATVEATPVRSEWDMGDGTVACTDAGSVYDPAARPDPASSSCAFTYRRSSGVRPDGVFHASVRVVWHLRWFATNGQGGDLGELSGPVAGFDVSIEESQALVAPN